MDTLLRRRAMMAGGTPPAPLPYTPVDYIETDGVAYINTGVLGNVPISSEVAMTPVASTANYYFLGCRKDSGATRLFVITITPAKNIGFSYYSGLYANLSIANSINNRTQMIVRARLRKGSQIISVKQAGESQFSSSQQSINSEVSTGLDMLLFAVNSAGTIVVSPSGARAKYAKIYSDFDFGTLVFDGVACLYNGEYGLWDNVSNTFFGNSAGSGAFTGPSI